MLIMLRKSLKFIYNKILNFNRNYPKNVAVDKENITTVNLCKKNKPNYYCEIGFYEGKTFQKVLEILPENSRIDLFDFEDRCKNISKKIKRKFKKRVNIFGNTYKFLDNYNNSLYKIWIKNKKKPKYDYIFLDGSHVFTVDCLTFFLAEKLLKQGGIIDLDDYNWSLEKSPTLNPKIFNPSKAMYSKKQIKEKGIKMIIDGFLKNSKNYREIIKNKAYRKIN